LPEAEFKWVTEI